ncbi:MAG: helix-hairpin-helix domain-containing protein [Myxococcota bacterium]
MMPAPDPPPESARPAARLPLWLRVSLRSSRAAGPTVEAAPEGQATAAAVPAAAVPAAAVPGDAFLGALRSLCLEDRRASRSEAPAQPRESVRVPRNPTQPAPASPLPPVTLPPDAPIPEPDLPRIARLETRLAALEARLDAERAGAAAVLALAKRLASLQEPLEAVARYATAPAEAPSLPSSYVPEPEGAGSEPPASAVHAAWPSDAPPPSSSWGLVDDAHPPVAPLLAVRGIGPSYARLLRGAGVEDAVALAALSDDELASLTASLRAAPRRALAWREAARALLAG